MTSRRPHPQGFARVLVWLVYILCLPFFLLAFPFFVLWTLVFPEKPPPHAHRFRHPPPLPTARIDICQRPGALAEQPPNCHLLKLPLELRRCIYEYAVGGRVIRLRLRVPFGRTDYPHQEVFATYHFDSDDLNGTANKPGEPAAGIPLALLLSCRQVYLEALPILHGRNIFHFPVSDFTSIFLAALGEFTLPDIRNVYLNHSHPVPYWPGVFELLVRMRHFDSLVFHLNIQGQAESVNSTSVSRWADGVVRLLRGGNVTSFAAYFTRDGAGDRVGEINVQGGQFIIGPEADEGCLVFFEELKQLEKAQG